MRTTGDYGTEKRSGGEMALTIRLTDSTRLTSCCYGEGRIMIGALIYQW